MIHLNPESGEVGTCRSQKGLCPFGAHNHFPTEAEAREAYEASQSELFTTHSVSPLDRLRSAETNLREAIRRDEGLEAARHRWQEASLTYAGTPEGQAYYSARAEGLGRAAEAARYFQLEGARRMVAQFDSHDLLDAMGAPEVSNTSLAPPVQWDNLHDEALYSGGRMVRDLKLYQRELDAFLADERSATPESFRKTYAAVTAYHSLRFSAAPYRRYETNEGRRTEYEQYFTAEEWREKQDEAKTYMRHVGERLLAHPLADENTFVLVGEHVDASMAFKHANASLRSREELMTFFASKKSIPADVLDQARDLRPGSNRIALYLSAFDTDDFHRQEAFNQVVMSGMETFSKEDRAWMATNMDRFPTTEGTVGTLKSSLRMWAMAYADTDEREKLLSYLPQAQAEPGEESRRGLFGRRRSGELER